MASNEAVWECLIDDQRYRFDRDRFTDPKESASHAVVIHSLRLRQEAIERGDQLPTKVEIIVNVTGHGRFKTRCKLYAIPRSAR